MLLHSFFMTNCLSNLNNQQPPHTLWLKMVESKLAMAIFWKILYKQYPEELFSHRWAIMAFHNICCRGKAIMSHLWMNNFSGYCSFSIFQNMLCFQGYFIPYIYHCNAISVAHSLVMIVLFNSLLGIWIIRSFRPSGNHQIFKAKSILWILLVGFYNLF